MDHRVEVARTLRAVHGLGYKRIARVLGTNRDQVRSWLGKGNRGQKLRYSERPQRVAY